MVSPTLGETRVGFYRRANGKRPSREAPLDEVLGMIKAGDLWTPEDGQLIPLTGLAVARAGAMEAEWSRTVAPDENGDKDNPAHDEYYRLRGSYSQLKGGTGPQTLSGATFGGIYTGCRDTGMQSHSGLVGSDLDHLGRLGRDAAAVRSQTAELSYVAFAFISPSGDGVKVFVLVDPVPTNQREQKAAWEQVGARLTQDLGLPMTTPDPKAKNLARLCFLGYDPDVYIADPAQLVPLQVVLEEQGEQKPKAKATARPRAQRRGPVAAPDGVEQVFGVSSDGSMRPHPSRWREACPWLKQRGQQLEGACPECGGDDRFHVNCDGSAPESDRYLWGCRECQERGKGTAPWYAAFRPWYRPGDFPESGHGQWECSPDADCLRLIRRFADQLLLVEAAEGGQHKLLVDNGYGVWRNAEDRLMTLLLLTAREWHRASAEASLDKNIAGAVARWAVTTAKKRARAEALDSVSTIAGWLAETKSWPCALTRAREVDLNLPGIPYIGTPTGVVDLENKTLLTGAAAREKLVTRTILDPYDAAATDPAVDRLLSHLTSENRAWLLRAIGWGMRGLPMRRFYFLDGRGNDGKSTLCNAMMQALGDYAGAPMAQALFNGGRERPDSPTSHLLTFQESPLVFISEPPKDGFNWDLARTISGGDTKNARQVHAAVELQRKRPYISTMFFCTNPDTRSTPPPMITDALYDRFRMLHFPHIVAQNRDGELPLKLRRPPARQALAALVIRHAMQNMEGPPDDTPDVAAAREEAKRGSLGEAGAWLSDRVEHTQEPRDILTTDEIWSAAVAESPDFSETTAWNLSRRQLTEFVRLVFEMPPAIRGRVRGKISHYWRGYRLRSPDEVVVPEAEPESIPSDAIVYCRICQCFLHENSVMAHNLQHIEEWGTTPFPCFLCGAPMPDSNPYLLICPTCEENDGYAQNSEAIVEGIYADMGLDPTASQ